EFYTAALERSVDAPALRERAFKVVLDYSYGAASIVMPSVLAKLGTEALAINPYASTAASAATELDRQVANIADLVRASGSQLGCVISADGELAAFVDDEGRPLSRNEALLVMVTLVAETNEHARIALPISVTQEAERLAGANGGEIIWTKRSDSHLMEVASSDDVAFAASADGRFIWPSFMPAYDGTASLAHLLDLLCATGRRLSEVVRELPAVHLAHETVPTPWERKGAVMRELVEQLERGGEHDFLLVDGVKVVRPDGWALVLPDHEQPSTHVWAEADNDETARQLAREYGRMIRQLLR